MDDDELEAEFADLQQQELDSNMLKTGSVPVGDEIGRLPNVATGESKCLRSSDKTGQTANTAAVKGKQKQAEEDDEEEELKRLQAEMAM